MKIVGFGDSFIQGIEANNPSYKNTYQGVLAKHFGIHPEFRGIPGSSPWDAFFDFLYYVRKEVPDVVIMAWSEASRLYQFKSTEENLELSAMGSNQFMEEVIRNVQNYIKFLTSTEKQNYELRALMTMFDEMVSEFPDTKFINLPCFAWFDQQSTVNWTNYTYVNPDQIKYHYRFKKSAEIRPCLLYLSKQDGWPQFNDMSKERRICHLTDKMHTILGNKIIHAITNYEPGLLIDIGLGEIR